MPYVPIHDRVSDLPSSPRYGSPDLDPHAPLKMSEREPESEAGYEYEADEDYDEYDAGPSRKRRRGDDDGDVSHGAHGSGPNGHGHGQGPSQPHQSQSQPSKSSSRPSGSSSASRRPPPVEQVTMDTAIQPSIFGIAPRNEFTKTIGEFIMSNCRGVENVEIEVKLGTLHAALTDGKPQRRIRMPTMTEMIMPPDYPVGPFASTMNKAHHASLNRLLNSAVEGSMHTANPLYFYRAQHVDSFYSSRGGKTRVSRDRNGNIIENGVVRKRRIADLNVYSPREAFDWRVSASVEDPAEMPSGPPINTREKDRACYRHQLCQVDLTVVTSRQGEERPTVSYELEIEVLDVPTLIAEGEKEERGEPNRFDEILQSVLDTARMLIRNV